MHLTEAWSDAERSLLAHCRDIFEATTQFPSDGSTGTVCMMIDDQIYVVNCGDSSAYAYYSNGESIRLTAVHGTENPDEVDRIKSAGGVLRDQTAFMPYKFPYCFMWGKQTVGKPRVYPGGLLVTRAFGDFSAKEPALGGKPNVVICNYDKIDMILMKEHKTRGKLKCIVLASDGVWDALTAEEVGKVVDGNSDNAPRVKGNVVVPVGGR